MERKTIWLLITCFVLVHQTGQLRVESLFQHSNIKELVACLR